MNLVERYLSHIAWRLSESTRAEIIEEMRDDILSRIEAIEAKSGTAATEAEIATVLRATGHPATVAAKYSEQGGLLPVEFVPWWWIHFRALAALVGVIYGIKLLLAFFAGRSPYQAVMQATTQGAWTFLQWVGVMTVTYLLVARYVLPKIPKAWNPDTLSAVVPERKDPTFLHALGLVFSLAILLCWTGVVASPTPEGVNAGPVWGVLYWPVLVLAALGVLRELTEIFIRSRGRTLAVATLIHGVLTVAIAGYALKNGPIAVLADGFEGNNSAIKTVLGINLVGPIILGTVALASLFEAWGAARRLLRAERTVSA